MKQVPDSLLYLSTSHENILNLEELLTVVKLFVLSLFSLVVGSCSLEELGVALHRHVFRTHARVVV